MAADRPSLTAEANIGLRTSNERPDRPPLAADASVVTAVANMPEAAARFARAGPQERSTHLPAPNSPAFCKTLPLHTFPSRTHPFTYCSLAARLPYAGESSQLMAGRRQGHRGPLPHRPRAARRRRPGRPEPLHRAKASTSTWSCHARQVGTGRCRTSCPIACRAAPQSYACVPCSVVRRGPCCACPCVLSGELPSPCCWSAECKRVAWHLFLVVGCPCGCRLDRLKGLFM